MTTSFNSTIVRIRTTDGRVVGAGFVVGQRQVLTCAHVVTGALGLPGDAQVQKPGVSEKTRFLLDFSLVAPERQLTARVMCWQRPDGGGSDVAGLELVDDLPAGPLRPARRGTGHLWAEGHGRVGQLCRRQGQRACR